MHIAILFAVVASVSGIAAAATECATIVDYAWSCHAEDGLIAVSPDTGSYLAANCRGYCSDSPVTIRKRPCAFCTAERCQTGYDVRGHPMVCCDEASCSAICEKPPENCRWNGDCTAWLCGRTIAASPATNGSSPAPAPAPVATVAPGPTPGPVSTLAPPVQPAPTAAHGNPGWNPQPSVPATNGGASPSPTPAVGDGDGGEGGIPKWGLALITGVPIVLVAVIGLFAKEKVASCGQGMQVFCHFNHQSANHGGVAVAGSPPRPGNAAGGANV